MRRTTKIWAATLGIGIFVIGLFSVQIVRQFVQYRHEQLICGNGDYWMELRDKRGQIELELNQTVMSGDIKQCDKIPYYFCDSWPRQKCYMAIAASTKDTTICRDKMEPLMKEREWAYGCYEKIAIQNRDKTFCDAAEELFKGVSNQPYVHLWPAVQAECYQKLVTTTGDSSICDSLNNENGKKFCRLKLGDSVGVCGRITDGLIRLMCESYLRVESSNSSE